MELNSASKENQSAPVVEFLPQEILSPYQKQDTHFLRHNLVNDSIPQSNFYSQAKTNWQCIAGELENAKNNILLADQILRQSLGPYNINVGAQQGYLKYQAFALNSYDDACKQADNLLYQTDKTGCPCLDQFGQPVPSEYHKMLNKQIKDLTDKIHSMSNFPYNSIESSVLAKLTQQKSDLENLSRASGITRANKYLAMLFDCQYRQGEDRYQNMTIAFQGLAQAEIFDPAMINNRSFQKHFNIALQAATGYNQDSRQLIPNPRFYSYPGESVSPKYSGLPSDVKEIPFAPQRQLNVIPFPATVLSAPHFIPQWQTTPEAIKHTPHQLDKKVMPILAHKPHLSVCPLAEKATANEEQNIIIASTDIKPTKHNSASKNIPINDLATQKLNELQNKYKAQSFVDSANQLQTNRQANAGLVDFIIPGSSTTINALTGSLFKHHASEIPVFGSKLFGGGKEHDNKIQNTLANALHCNPKEARDAVEKNKHDTFSSLRGVMSDVAGVGGFYLAKAGLNKGIPYALELLAQRGLPMAAQVSPGPLKILSIGGALLAGGLIKDYLADGKLGTKKDWLRFGEVTTLSSLAMETMKFNPAKSPLSASTLSKLATKFSIDTTGKTTAASLTPDLVNASGKNLFLHTAQVIHLRLNPLTYLGVKTELAPGGSLLNPFKLFSFSNWRFSHVGFGGENTAKALLAGNISLAKWQAQHLTGDLITNCANAFTFGAAYKGIQLHTEKSDHKDRNLNGQVAELFASGVDSAVTSILTLPFNASCARGLGLGKAMDNTSKLLLTGLTKINNTGAQNYYNNFSNLMHISAHGYLSALENFSCAIQLKQNLKQAEKLISPGKLVDKKDKQ